MGHLEQQSQLAIEFAHQVAERSADKWVFWVHAGTWPRVEEGFRAIAEAVKLPGRNQSNADIPKLVSGWLSNERNGRWVMVLDSADDIDVFYGEAASTGDGRPLASYLPQSRNGSILVTTRNKDLAFRLVGNHCDIISVGPMTEEDALLLLEKRLGSLSDVEVATDLVRALDLIPLPISQAAAYIQARAPRSSLEKYLVDFRASERKRARLLGHDAGDLRREGGASNSVRTTWEISFDYIRSKRPSAADLLSLMSFFDPQGIPESLLKPEHSGSQHRDSGHSESESSDGETDDSFDDDVAMLSDYCLVTVNEGGVVFEMHGLVQLSTRKWLETHGVQEAFKKGYIKRLTAAFPKADDHGNWPACQKLFAHVEAAVDLRPAEGRIQETWATLMYKGGRYATWQCSYDVGERMLRQAKGTREERFGPEHEATLQSLLALGIILLDKGLEERAEELFIQVAETKTSVLGADHPDTLVSMGYLAVAFRKQGRLEKAEGLWVEVMEAMRRKLGADHPHTLWGLHDLASVYWDQGRYEESEKLTVQGMEAYKISLGADNPRTLAIMHNLACTWKSLGRYADAWALMRNCVEASRRVLGPKHLNTLLSVEVLEGWNSESG